MWETKLAYRNVVGGSDSSPVVPKVMVQVRILGKRVHQLRGEPPHHSLPSLEDYYYELFLMIFTVINF